MPKKLLLHACCGPCSLEPTRLFAEEGWDVTIHYANSNIQPDAEYARRLAELESWARAAGIPVIEDERDVDAWERAVAPAAACQPEGASARDRVKTAATVAELLDDERRRERCRACYRLRLAQTARAAAEGGFDAASTTLTVSPYQFSDVIHEELDRACAQAGVQPLFRDFRPYYAAATQRSRALGMYRQDYCGCRFSIREGQATRDFLRERRRQRAAEKRERSAGERAAERDARAQRAAQKRAWANERERRHSILKELRQEQRRAASEKAQEQA